MGRPRTAAPAAGVIAAACLALSAAARGADAEPYGVRATNPWPSVVAAGYWPAVVTIENHSGPAEAVVVLSPSSGYGNLCTVERPVTLSRGETARVVLPVPVGDWGRYKVQVYVDGHQMLRRPPALDVPHTGGYGSTGQERVVIAVSNDAPDLRPLEAVFSGAGPGGGASGSVEHVTPDELPDLWQPYSAVGLCAVDIDAFVRMTPAQRSALGQWVLAGGSCLVHRVASAGERTLVIDGLGLAGTHRSVVEAAHEDGSLWRAEIGMGRCLFVADSVFPKTEAWWRHVVTDAGNAPIAARIDRDRERTLAIPGVGDPPVGVFLLISVAFIFLIGPANWYVVLRKMKRPALFLLTTPAIAVTASVLMLVYSFVSEGFGTHVAVHTLSVLDPESHRGVTWSHHAVYAGIAPRGGLAFDASTLVLEHDVPDGRKTASWSDGLRLRGAWLPARTKCSYVTCAQFPARWRVLIEREGGGWKITNGLPRKMERVTFATPEGVVSAVGVSAGGAAAGLSPSRSASMNELGPIAPVLKRFGVGRQPAGFLSDRAVPGSPGGGYIPYLATLTTPLGAELGFAGYEVESGRHVVVGLAELGPGRGGAP